MCKSYGSKQQAMRQMTIKQENDYLGKFCCIVNPGSTQSMIFQPGDEGPFGCHLRNENKKDMTGTQEKQKRDNTP